MLIILRQMNLRVVCSTLYSFWIMLINFCTVWHVERCPVLYVTDSVLYIKRRSWLLLLFKSLKRLNLQFFSWDVCVLADKYMSSIILKEILTPSFMRNTNLSLPYTVKVSVVHDTWEGIDSFRCSAWNLYINPTWTVSSPDSVIVKILTVSEICKV